MYEIPRHLRPPRLSDAAAEMLDAFAVTCQRSHGGYLASWHLADMLQWSADLDMAAYGQGNDAMRELRDHGLVEPVPDLGCRYRLTERGALLAITRQIAPPA